MLYFMHTFAYIALIRLFSNAHVCIGQIDPAMSEVQRRKVDHLRRQEVSIEDIARAAGVSHSTVSRALRDSTLISVNVRERIQRLANEMGYTPNAIAQSLQTRQTSTIGLVVTSIADQFWGDVMKGVEEVARASDFSVFLSASHNDPDQEMAIIETFHRRRVDGILVAASRITSNYQKRLDHIQVPTVLINSQAESEARLLHWVSVDDRQGAQLAVEHLLQLGHRAIGYLGISSRPRSNQQRLLGYQNTLAAAGVQYRDEWAVIMPGDEASHEEDVAAGQTSLPRLLDAGVTAIFCYNDMTALGVLVACRERGIAVPGAMSVIGFDDIRMASYATPPLTTVQQPKVLLGRLATQVMLELLHNRPGRNHLLPPTLMLRASTAPLTGG
jgi:LacI family transcriptional regulator/LacI family repressor for deo operon, udp, cdd, tsx, nupC, and nupG